MAWKRLFSCIVAKRSQVISKDNTSVGQVLAFSHTMRVGRFLKTICEALRAWALEIFRATYTQRAQALKVFSFFTSACIIGMEMSDAHWT
jgi:hypothetical protein